MRAVLFLLLALPFSLSAKIVGGVEFSDEAKMYNSDVNLFLQGASVRKKLFVDVYAGALYSGEKITNADNALEAKSPKQMRMVFIYNNLSANKLKNAWVEGITNNNPKEDINKNKDNLDKFYSIFNSSMSKGDELVIQQSDSGSTDVFINKNQIVSINGNGFFNLLLNTWVGSKPPSKQFKQDLFTI